MTSLPQEAPSPQPSKEFTYSYPFGTCYFHAFGFLIMGIVLTCAAIFLAGKIIIDEVLSFRAIFLVPFLLYVGLNFVYLAIWRFPCRFRIDDRGVQMFLIGKREIFLSWSEIEILEDNWLTFRFGPARTALARILITKDYIVLHSIPLLSRFFHFKRVFIRMHKEHFRK